MIGLESRPGCGGGGGACQMLSASFPVAAGRAWPARGQRWEIDGAACLTQLAGQRFVMTVVTGSPNRRSA
jgi:hypothetical protein